MHKILLSLVLTIFLLTGCNEKEEVKTTVKAETKTVEKTPIQEELLEKVKSSSENISEKVKEASKQIGEIVAKTSKEVGVEASGVTKEIIEKSDEITQVISAEVEKSTNKMEDTINNIMSSAKSSDDQGKKLFLKCSGCHGQKGELVPSIGKSKIIRGWEKVRIIYALKGYQEGTYGGPMKGVMRGQVATLKDNEIEILADYISKL